ncbi:MAG: hypothetical protein ACYC3I_15290 [Gemmataceae bacterium]
MKNTFTGWIRLPGQTWKAIVHAATEDEAWRLLRQHVDQLAAKSIDSYIGPSSVDPRGRRPVATQRRMF